LFAHGSLDIDGLYRKWLGGLLGTKLPFYS
jgi:hypothetical protein